MLALVCNATLMSKDSLKKHMYVQHEGGRETWACDLCSNKLGSKDSLKRHYKSVHGIDRSELTVEDGHHCNVCKLCFGTKYTLAEHKCSGTDETQNASNDNTGKIRITMMSRVG